MDIVAATAKYEEWIAQFFDPLVDELRRKHEEMRAERFIFLRATFYRWAQQWEQVAASVRQAPVVLAVGDAHVENFGTWRDAEGRLVWGVNDFDEATRLPYTSDLVRLATSAMLAHAEGQLAIAPDKIPAAILRGYDGALSAGGRSVVLDSGPRWLRELLPDDLRNPERYWDKLFALSPWRGAVSKRARELLGIESPTAQLIRIVHRISGVGSLGRPRLTALYIADGGFVAREVKARAPSAWRWAQRIPGAPKNDPLPRIWRDAIRSQDPYLHVTARWILRRLAPDCVRIKVASFPKRHEESALLTAMGWDLANIHLGSLKPRRVLEHLGTLRRMWLREAVDRMVDSTEKDFSRWQRAR